MIIVFIPLSVLMIAKTLYAFKEEPSEMDYF